MIGGGCEVLLDFQNCTAPGLEDRILGEEQTLSLKGTGGL